MINLLQNNLLLKNIKISYKSNKLKILALTWKKNPELPYGSYSISDSQDYFEYINRKLKILTDDLPIKILINKIEKRITFKIKRSFCLEPSPSETMKLLGSTKNNITKNRNGGNILETLK